MRLGSLQIEEGHQNTSGVVTVWPQPVGNNQQKMDAFCGYGQAVESFLDIKELVTLPKIATNIYQKIKWHLCMPVPQDDRKFPPGKHGFGRCRHVANLKDLEPKINKGKDNHFIISLRKVT